MNNNPVKNICEIYAEAEHERVVLWSDASCNYRGIIAIHSTALGPAVGGTRFWNYASDAEASRDALRLSVLAGAAERLVSRGDARLRSMNIRLLRSQQDITLAPALPSRPE